MTHNGIIKRKAKSPVRVQEKDGHLQFRVMDEANCIVNAGWAPQALRHHSSITLGLTVEHPSVLVGKLNPDMFRNRSGDEIATFFKI